MFIAFLSLLLAWGSADADSAFGYVNGETGAYFNALGLGGIGRHSSAEVLFHNPAQLGDIVNSDAAVAITGYPGEKDPALSVATRASTVSVVGFGYRPLGIGGLRENQFVLSSSFTPTRIFWSGANIKYLYTHKNMAFDMDLGAIWNAYDLLRVSAALENVLGSAFRKTPADSRARAAQIGSSFFWGRHAADGCNLFARTHFQDWQKITVGGAVEKRVFRNPQIMLRAGTYYGFGNPSTNGVTLGMGIQQDLKEQRILLEYALKRPQAPEPGSHHVTLHFALYGARDRIPPVISIKTDRTGFSPDGDGKHDMVYFHLKAQDNPGGVGFKSWALVLASRKAGQQPRQIKAFVGGGIPPSTIAWDGRNSSGVLVSPGTYLYMFTAQDRNGNQAKSDWMTLRVR